MKSIVKGPKLISFFQSDSSLKVTSDFLVLFVLLSFGFGGLKVFLETKLVIFASFLLLCVLFIKSLSLAFNRLWSFWFIIFSLTVPAVITCSLFQVQIEYFHKSWLFFWMKTCVQAFSTLLRSFDVSALSNTKQSLISSEFFLKNQLQVSLFSKSHHYKERCAKQGDRRAVCFPKPPVLMENVPSVNLPPQQLLVWWDNFTVRLVDPLLPWTCRMCGGKLWDEGDELCQVEIKSSVGIKFQFFCSSLKEKPVFFFLLLPADTGVFVFSTMKHKDNRNVCRWLNPPGW